MPGISRPELDAAVLVAGDAEADLGALARVLRSEAAFTIHIARGVPAACAALRDTEYGAVVADVANATDALALLRAAGRGRPPARVICLLPAGSREDQWGDYLLHSAAAVERHPIPPEALTDLVRSAVRDHQQARVALTQRPRRDARDRDAWREAESALAESLAAFVDGQARSRSPRAEGAPLEVRRVAAEIARHVRSGDGGIAVLHALAGAFSPRTGRAAGKEAA